MNELHYKIQTRYFRSPEVILQYNLTEKCDMWSVGCMIYELLTGKILFNPGKNIRFSRDRYHILAMYNNLGPIPKNLIKKSKNKNVFFTKNGLLKNGYKIKYTPLSQIICEDLQDRIDDDELILIIDLMYKLFEYDPLKRISIKECMKHKFFSKIC